MKWNEIKKYKLWSIKFNSLLDFSLHDKKLIFKILFQELHLLKQQASLLSELVPLKDNTLEIPLNKQLKWPFKYLLAFVNVKILVNDLSNLQKQSNDALIALSHKLVQTYQTESFLLLLVFKRLNNLFHLLIQDTGYFVDQESVVITQCQKGLVLKLLFVNDWDKFLLGYFRE